MEHLRTPVGENAYWKANSELYDPVRIEVLEPRILLSGDNLFSIDTPEQLYSLVETVPQIVQYAELPEKYQNIKEQLPSVEQQSCQEHDLHHPLESDIYKPIFTLFDDDKGDENLQSPTASDEAFGLEML